MSLPCRSARIRECGRQPRSSSRILPSSSSIMTAVVVATTFVKRREIEDGVGRHRLARGREGALARSLSRRRRLQPRPTSDDRSRQPLLGDRLGDERPDRVEALSSRAPPARGRPTLAGRRVRRDWASSADRRQQGGGDHRTMRFGMSRRMAVRLTTAAASGSRTRARLSTACGKNVSHCRRIRSSLAACADRASGRSTGR